MLLMASCFSEKHKNTQELSEMRGVVKAYFLLVYLFLFKKLFDDGVRSLFLE